jgi:imidazolonepropionase
LTEYRLRLEQTRRTGTTTIEIKSGYGGQPHQELRQLQIINRLKNHTPIEIYTTALAHGIPLTYKTRRSAYTHDFCHDVIAAAAQQNLIEHIDVFVEQNAHSPQEATEFARYAADLDLGLKLHVDQLADRNGAQIAGQLRARSADHLEFTSKENAHELAQAGTIATILPGCRFFLGTGPWPPARMLREAGCEIAIATDANPGSCPTSNLPLCASMAISQCKLTLDEALWGITRGGAKALGLHDRGRLIPKERADFVVIDHSDWRRLFYAPGDPAIFETWIAGQRQSEPQSSDPKSLVQDRQQAAATDLTHH